MANGSKVTPPITSRGLFEVEKPYKIDERKVYEVVAIREFPDLWTQHTDIYAVYYAPFGLDESIYERDKNLGASIVSLKYDAGIYHIPDTFIVNYPEMGYTHYKHIVLSVSLGAVHQNRNLDALREEIKDLVTSHLGTRPEVKMHIAPTTDAITERDAKLLEELRGNARLGDSTSLLLREERNRNSAIIALNNARLGRLQGQGYNEDRHTAESSLDNYVMRNIPAYSKYVVPTKYNYGGTTTDALSNLINAGSSLYDWMVGDSGKPSTMRNPVTAGRKGSSFQIKGKSDSITGWLGSLFEIKK